MQYADLYRDRRRASKALFGARSIAVKDIQSPTMANISDVEKLQAATEMLDGTRRLMHEAPFKQFSRRKEIELNFNYKSTFLQHMPFVPFNSKARNSKENLKDL